MPDLHPLAWSNLWLMQRALVRSPASPARDWRPPVLADWRNASCYDPAQVTSLVLGEDNGGLGFDVRWLRAQTNAQWLVGRCHHIVSHERKERCMGHYRVNPWLAVRWGEAWPKYEEIAGLFRCEVHNG